MARCNPVLCVLVAALLGTILAALVEASAGSTLTSGDWMQRTIYQVMIDRFALDPRSSQKTSSRPPAACAAPGTYCGGELAGITAKLPYIRALGADAIALSPISSSTEWHGFSPLDLYSIDEHFGKARDLRNLLDEAHRAGMRVFLTVQFNHMGGSNNTLPFYARPFNNPSWYHDCQGCDANCSIANFSYYAPELEHCRLGGMPDLNTSSPVVRQALWDWANWLTTRYTFDGLLVDMVKYVDEEFFPLVGTAARLKPFLIADITMEDADAFVASSNERFDSFVAYPLHAALRSVFAGNVTMRYLAAVVEEMQQQPTTVPYAVSVDRLRGDRFLHVQPDQALYRNALAFVLLNGGVPILPYGTEQGMDAPAEESGLGFAAPPLWEYSYNTTTPLFTFIAAINSYRTKTGLSSDNALLRHVYQPVYVDDALLVFQRGPTIVVLTNGGTNVTATQLTLMTPGLDSLYIYPGTTLCNVADNNNVATLDGQPVVVGGELGVPVVTIEVTGEPLVLVDCETLVM